ncbi:MAG: MFS transporter, partial [Acidobacteriota bacterium]|nr:MFS transporter [Acidobacteriota bacterium]
MDSGINTGVQTPPASLSFREVFALPGVRRLWIAQFVSVMGDLLALFAILSLASFRLHATAEQVTLISMFYMLPMAVIGPVAGVFVDRWNVKAVMIASDLIRCGLAVLLVFARDINSFYLILFALSFVSTFFAPAQSVTVRTIIPKHGLLAANALLMQAFLVTRIASPAMAGALVGTFGPESCFYADALSFLVSALMLSGIAIQRLFDNTGPPAGGVGSVLRDLVSGMKFLFGTPALSFVLIAMGAGFFVMSCFGPLIAIYVRDFLHEGSLAFGLFSALIGVGMMVGTMGLRKFGMKIASEKMVLVGLVLIGGSVLLMGGVRLAATTALSSFTLGFGVAFILTPAQTLMMGKTPVAMVGRVSSSFMSVIAVSQMLGLVVSGSAAERIGILN